MKDLLSIHEFSKISGVETSTLRYWDDIGLFSPIQRNPDNNYRYYSPAQITALNFVTTLSDLEIPLKTIGELRNERDPDNFLKLLEKQERQMDMEMRQLRMRYSIIHARQELIRYGATVGGSQISVLHRDDKAIILWPRNEYQEGGNFIDPLTAFIKDSHRYHINLSFPVGGYYDNMETFIAGPDRPSSFFSIDPLGHDLRKAGDYLIGFSHGYYGDVGDLPQQMAAYAKEHKLAVVGPVYLMYLYDEICTQYPEEYLSQACVAISKSKTKRR